MNYKTESRFTLGAGLKAFAFAGMLSCFIAAKPAEAQAQKYVQVMETATKDAKNVKDHWVTENDSVKITYHFWSEKGILSFAIHNKLTVPLFIDWEQSTFKSLGETFDYWPDNEPGKPEGIRADFHYDGPPVMPGHTATQGVGGAGANKNRTARLSEIEPNGDLIRSSYYIFPKPYFDMGAKYTSRHLALREDKSVMTLVYELDFHEKNTPLRFSNAVAYSTSEDFKSKGTLAAEFKLEKVTEMEARQFKNKSKESMEDAKNGSSPYASPRSFYVSVPAGQGVKK
ncbi:MAG: hypothetical protein V4543_14275 [Bacteroidota bacterium]